MAIPRPGVVRLLSVILAFAAVVLASCNDDEDLPRAAGLWFAFPETVHGHEGPIRLVHVDSGDEEAIGPAGIYRNVSWSPQGHLIAALRAGNDTELVLFNLEDPEAETLTQPLDVEDAQLSWSPDGLRLVVVSPAGMALFSRDLELVADISPPEEPLGPAEFSHGSWSPDSAFFATYFHGYLVVMDRIGQIQPIDPAQFVRYPGETRWMTITGWESADAVAIFEESDERSPTRYVVNVRGEEPEVLSSSDFEEGVGPFDGLLQQASEAAGGSDVLLGHSAAPPYLRWVVATAGPGDAPVRVLVRRGEIFLAAASGLFARADPELLARDLSVMFVSPETIAR